jgi:hypothetical protein
VKFFEQNQKQNSYPEFTLNTSATTRDGGRRFLLRQVAFQAVSPS